MVPSLTIFIPFYNDAGTVQKAITESYKWGRKVTKDLEVIAIHGGASRDNTWQKIREMRHKFRSLKIVDKSENTEGYAVIKHGFKHATKQWIFYTDGDLQYSIKDLLTLVRTQNTTNADVVNGYKTKRADPMSRTIFGAFYSHLSRLMYNLPIHDLTCDFRLIKSAKIKKIRLESTNASVLLELILKLKKAKSTFAEVPVSHRKRIYGRSNYKGGALLLERVKGDILVYHQLKPYNKGYENRIS